MEFISPEEFKKGKRAGSGVSLPSAGAFEFVSPEEFVASKPEPQPTKTYGYSMNPRTDAVPASSVLGPSEPTQRIDPTLPLVADPQAHAAHPSRQLPVIGPVLRALDRFTEWTQPAREVAMQLYTPGAGLSAVGQMAASVGTKIAQVAPGLGRTIGGRVAAEAIREGAVGVPVAMGQALAHGASDREALEQGAIGGALGAVTGGAVPVVGEAIRRGVQSVRSAPSAQMRAAVNELVQNIETPRQDFIPHPAERITPQGVTTRTVREPSVLVAPIRAETAQPIRTDVQAMAMTVDGRPLLPAAREVGSGVSREVVKRSDIIADLSKGLGITIRTGRYREPAHGIFKVREGVVRTKLTNDLPVISHEIGHALDKRYRLSSSLFDDELLKLGRTTSGPEYTRDQIRKEGVAEFFRLMLTDPEEAQRLAPKFFARYNELVSPNDKAVISAAQQRIRQYLDQDLITRSFSELSVGEKEKRRLPSLSSIYTKFVDELNPVKEKLKALGEKGQQVFEGFWLLRGVSGRARAFLRYGRVDQNFQRIGKSFDEILEPVKANLDEFRTYIKERRAIELAQRNIMTGSDLSVADRQRVVQALEERFPHFRQAQRELIEYQDAILQELVDSGILSADDVRRFKQANQEYVPFFRVYEAEAGAGAHKGGRSTTNIEGSPVKRIKGSDRDIVDPLESIVKNTYQYIAIAERNRALLNLVDTVTGTDGFGNLVEKIPAPMRAQTFSLDELRSVLEKAGAKVDEIDTDAIVSIFRPQNVAPGKDNVIAVYRNGKREFYQLDPDLYRAVTFADKEQMNAIVRALNFPARLLRSGIVNTMEFWFKNMFRDQFAAMVNSRYGYIPYIDLIRGMAHVLRKDDVFLQFLSAGGAQGLRQSLDRNYLQADLRKILAASIRDKTLNVIKNPVEAMRALSELSELGTRVGEFARGIRKDSSREGIRKAALSARDLIDFGRAGTVGKHINKVSAFWNAQVQGLDRMIRTFSDPKLAPKAFAKSLAVITGPTIWLYEKNKHDPRYQELPQWDKDLFWHIWIGDTHIRLPIPFELGVVFKVIPERLARMMEGDDEAFRGFGETVRDTIPVPTTVHQALSFISLLAPIAEVTANRTYTGAPVVPMYQQNELPEDQFGPYTSEVAKLIARGAGRVGLDETIIGSPRKIDHLISGYTGSLGRYATQGIDAVLDAIGAVERIPRPASGLEDAPGTKAFIGRPFGGTTASIERFYDRIDELTEQKKRAQKRGEYFEGEGELRRLEMLKRNISDITKQIRSITSDPNLSPEEKRDQIRRLEVVRNNLARIGLGMDTLQYEDVFGGAR